jgi:hypothetical protein
LGIHDKNLLDLAIFFKYLILKEYNKKGYQMKELKTKIFNLDYISVGTLSKGYRQCGKLSCRCSTRKEYWHGPYYIWTRKENGKTITKSLSAEQAKRCKKALKNMKKLNQCIQKWKKESVKYIEKIH